MHRLSGPADGSQRVAKLFQGLTRALAFLTVSFDRVYCELVNADNRRGIVRYFCSRIRAADAVSV